MTGSIFMEVTGSIHMALGWQSSPGFHVSHIMPGKKELQDPLHYDMPGQSVDWQTSYYSTADIKLDGIYCWDSSKISQTGWDISWSHLMGSSHHNDLLQPRFPAPLPPATACYSWCPYHFDYTGQ